MADPESATARGADPSVASLPGVKSVVGVEGVPGVVNVVGVDDDVMSTGSRANLAKLYDRASAVSPFIGGGNVSRRGHGDP